MAKARRKKSRKSVRSKRRPASRKQLAPPPRFAMEQMNRMIGKVLSEHEFEDAGEVQAYLEKHVMRRNLDELLAEREPDPVEMAQDMAYEAMESEDPEEMLGLVQRALELDPNCTDALMLLANLTAPSDAGRIEAVSSVVKRAEQTMGKEFFKENKGYFWGVIETRPYMRARATLVHMLRGAGRADEAISHCEAMLDLNPNDNQGIRDILLGLYLETRNLIGARKLLDQYPGSHFAVFAWGHVLERFLMGDLESAEKGFAEANKNNPHVLDFLTGKRRLPRKAPEYYELGETSEAVLCVQEIGQAWKKHPEAVEWLKSLR